MSLTQKNRMLSTLAGRPTDRIPWAPRLDLWYNAHKHAGTLPAPYQNATLMEITDDLGWAYHAVVPHFKDLRSAEDEINRALGVYNLWSMPFRTEFDEVKLTSEQHGDRTTVTHETPVGTLRTQTLYDENMRRSGITITHITEHAIKIPSDYPAICHLFDHARVVPNNEGYQRFHEQVGERGLAVAFISLAGSPMHLLQRELMDPILFFTELYDHPDQLIECAQSIGRYFERVFEAVAQCPAEVVLFGANYDATMTYPPFFAEHITPWLKRLARRLHAKDKYLLTHTDGENTGLLDHYLESEIDITDSICPAPMTKLTFQQVRERFAGRITIMGGIPSTVLLPEVMSEKDFDAWLDTFFERQIGAGDRLILGVSDTTPPAAKFERLKRIAEYIEQFGPVKSPVVSSGKGQVSG